MDFERDLLAVWMTDFTRYIVAGGQSEVGFTAKFIFKRADGEPGHGPTVTIQSSVEVDASDSFDAVEANARTKAMSIVRRLSTETDASLDAIVATEKAELSKTKEEQEAEFNERLTASIKGVGAQDS